MTPELETLKTLLGALGTVGGTFAIMYLWLRRELKINLKLAKKVETLNSEKIALLKEKEESLIKLYEKFRTDEIANRGIYKGFSSVLERLITLADNGDGKIEGIIETETEALRVLIDRRFAELISDKTNEKEG